MLSTRFAGLGTVLAVLLQFAHIGTGIKMDINDPSSIKSAARTVADGMMSYYHGNESGQTVGMLPGPYYWWEAGAMWMTMIEYYYYTGDPTYNDVVMQALLAQVGANDDYEPANVTKQLGNDDQAFWAFAALTAAELKFPDPPNPKDPQWLALAQAVFNRQAGRWDTDYCGGGLRWQIFPFNNGYDYKNSVSNGAFFQLSARLYRYTGNQTYADWAHKVYDWITASPLLSKTFHVYDGSATAQNCTQADHHEWTYNSGMFISGCAYMYNATNQSTLWHDRLVGFIDAAQIFFNENSTYGPVMVEVACEPYNTCNYDQPSFKAYLSRWMTLATQLAPFTEPLLMPKLRSSAQGAASQCSGGPQSTTCGRFWNSTTWSGHQGVGEQMSALSIIQAMLVDGLPGPVTAADGGTSKGDPNAGTSGDDPTDPFATDPITKADRAGAGIVTAIMLILTGVMAYVMVV